MRSLVGHRRRRGASFQEGGPDRGFRPGRLIRTFRRWLHAVDDYARHVRPMSGTYAALGFLGAWVGYGMALSGDWRPTAEALTAAAGFRVQSIEIQGLAESDSTEIVDRIDVTAQSSLMMLDVERARQRVAEIPWVSDVSVKKLYPHRIVVSLNERLPFALWQDDGRLKVVDRTGAVMSETILARHTALPLVVGTGANARAEEAVDLMASAPSIRSRVRAAVLVAERRWNLVTVEGVEIRLPEEDPKAALARVAQLQATKRLLDRDIVAVDVRAADKLFVRLSDAAAEQRKEMNKARMPKKRGTDT